jgi:hypothetical protein
MLWETDSIRYFNMVPQIVNFLSINRKKIVSIHSALKLSLILLFTVCVFDPGNLLLGLKMPLFILTWVIFLLDILLNYKTLYVSVRVISYLVLFIFIIPITSIIYYFVTNGDLIHYDGYLYFKTYLFLTVVLILFVSKIDLVKSTIIILTFLSLTIFVLYIKWYLTGFSLTYSLLKMGEKYLIVRFGIRDFLGLHMKMLYVETTPLLVFSVGYFAKRLYETRGLKRVLSGLLLVINMIAMFIGATRNNMFFSIITPLLVLYWYSRRKAFVFIAVAALMIIIVGSNWSAIQNMLSSKETSNGIKITFLDRYFDIFSNMPILIFGQGLGSYFHSSRGLVSNSELTYLEIVRRFGLILSTIIFVMLLSPLTILITKKYRDYHYIFLCYLFYLVISATNPLLMSSTGMLFLSIVLYKTFSLRYSQQGN